MRASACLSYAQRGPLFSRLQPAVPPAEEWARHGGELASELCGGAAATAAAPEELGTAAAARIFHLYLPLYFWCLGRARQAPTGRAVGIGISAPQGCGKTTLVDTLVGRFAADGLVCAAASFDDFYLTHEAQRELAAAHPTNRLLELRGNAGSHDVALGTATLRALLDREAEVAVPRYDKAAFGGRGDRAPEEAWHVQRDPVDVLLFEGWMAGFAPAGDAARLAGLDPDLALVDSFLRGYAEWHDKMDAWAVIGIDDLSHVCAWRTQAEQAMAAAGRPGMDDAAVADFVSRYLPAYRAYLPALYTAAQAGGVGGKPTLLARVDGSRRVVPTAELGAPSG